MVNELSESFIENLNEIDIKASEILRGNTDKYNRKCRIKYIYIDECTENS